MLRHCHGVHGRSRSPRYRNAAALRLTRPVQPRGSTLGGAYALSECRLRILLVWGGEHGAVLVLATLTDHIGAHKGDMQLFWDPLNHQSHCKLCRDRKTSVEDGDCGRPGSRPHAGGGG